MTVELEKPLPVPTPTSAPFWEGLRAGEVRIQRCEACAAWVFYPRVRCPRCLSDRLAWHTVSGRGRLVTFTIARQPTAPHFADEVPQKLAVVELEEGVRLTTTLVAEESAIRIGMAVVPVFDPVSDEVTLLRYRPA
jgi:uncharacterized OB-fold protein